MADLAKFTDNSKILMLALDHRESFRKLINPDSPESVSDDQIIELKKEIINSIVDQISGLLIDETYGLASYQEHKKPFLLPVEKSGFKDVAGERLNELEYQVSQLREMGATGIKMLLYFNPDAATAHDQIQLAQEVAKQCQQSDMPFFLEPVTYRIGDGDHTQDSDLVLRSLKMLLDNEIRPDVFKVEYPGSFEACQKVGELLEGRTWILLTNPDSFDDFVKHLKEAVSAGCRGFLAGRALWQEATKLAGEEKLKFLNETLSQRFKIIADIVMNS